MKKVLTLLLLITSGSFGLLTAEHEESLYVERTHKVTKKNKSLDTVREEFVRACEECMHGLIREIRVIRSVCKKFQNGVVDTCIGCMFTHRGMLLKRMHMFFVAPTDGLQDCTHVECTHKEKQAIPLDGLALVGAVAMVQEDLLQAMSNMLELASGSPFVCASKKQLVQYSESLNQCIKESEDFCAQALAL